MQAKQPADVDFTEQLTNTLTNYYEKFIDILPRLGLGLLIIILGILIAGVISRFATNRVKARTPAKTLLFVLDQ